MGSMARPKMVEVESTSIARVGFEPAAQELYVMYRDSGTVYVYAPVDEFTYRRLMRSDRKGAFVNREIKPNFDFREI
jgi:hypothetical protein